MMVLTSPEIFNIAGFFFIYGNFFINGPIYTTNDTAAANNVVWNQKMAFPLYCSAPSLINVL